MSAAEQIDWIADAIPPGSARYYAWLHHRQTDRDRLASLLGLQRIWSQAGFTRQPGDAIRLKFDWWVTELADNRARHPLTARLAAAIAASPPLQCQLLDTISGYRELVRGGSPSATRDNAQFHQSTGAAMCRAIAASESEPGNNNRQIDAAGIALSQWRCLRYLSQHIESGLLCLPASALDAAGLGPADLRSTDQPNPALNALFEQQLQQVSDALTQASQALLTCPVVEQKSLFIYVEVQRRLLAATRQSGADLLAAQIRLTPLRNYWFAGKAARQYERALRNA